MGAPPFIEITYSLDDQELNPTPQQRKVHGFYDAQNSTDAEDIYSPEWFKLTQKFFSTYTIDKSHPKMLKSWEMVEDLEFGQFFLAHPVAAYSLRQVLEACYRLDDVVCGTSPEMIQKITKWKNKKPFLYLRNKEVKNEWKKSLKSLTEQIKGGKLKGEELMNKLNDILAGVEKLEITSSSLKESFETNLNGYKFVDEMIMKVADAVEERIRMIVDIL